MEPAAPSLRGQVTVVGGTVGWAFTAAHDGDLAATVPDDVRHQVEQSVVALRWVMTRQVHGAAVLRLTGSDELPSGVSPADSPGTIAGVDADAIVTDRPGLAVAVRTGDCAPLLLVGDGPVVAAVHAGWRGLVAGVVESAVASLGVPVHRALLGPCIGPCCYAFGADDLAAVEGRFGAGVSSETRHGAVALDLPATVTAALLQAGVASADRIGSCTGCGEPRMFSHRIRAEAGRQAGVVWIDGDASD
jgi:polyphenol oxidase